MNSSSTNSVVVFIPPPVEFGDAPININNIVTILVSAVSAFWSMLANPAVLAVTLWNNEFTILFQTFIFPMVFGLFHSNISVVAKPINNKASVVYRTTRTCCLFCFLWSSSITNPIPPSTISNIIGSSNRMLVAYGVKLANCMFVMLRVSNPALQKLATDKNIAQNIPYRVGDIDATI